MKVKYYSACTNEDFDIDGIRFSDFPLDEQKEILKKVVDKLDYIDYNCLLDLLHNINSLDCTYESEPCDQCGHVYVEEEWEI